MIVVIADDLSGAAELAGVASRHGLTAEVQTELSWETKADVVCVDTDTRALSPKNAARVVRAVAEGVVAAGPEWIFKKCDSVLRGSVLAEGRAVAWVAGKTRIVILSANPSRGRFVRNGNLFLAGVPLHETAFADDPGHPRTTSSVAEMLGSDLKEVCTPDAESTADVTRCVAALDDDILPVGGADFFEALLRARVPNVFFRSEERAPRTTAGDTLLVCGSAASWGDRRAEAMGLNLPVFALPYDVAAAIETLRTTHQMVIGIGDGAATRGPSPAELVGKLSDAVVQILRETNVTCLLSEGGATTAAVMRAMGWTRLEAIKIPAFGVSTMRPVGATGPMFFIKPGSYPWPREIWPPTA